MYFRLVFKDGSRRAITQWHVHKWLQWQGLAPMHGRNITEDLNIYVRTMRFHLGNPVAWNSYWVHNDF